MKLKKLADIINKTVKEAGDMANDVDVEIYWEPSKNKEPVDFKIKRIGQFGFIPDVTIELEVIKQND